MNNQTQWAEKLSEYRQKLEYYERVLAELESRYEMDSANFYDQFEQGLMGDHMDYFEWAGIWELHQKASEKVAKIQSKDENR